jgi:hypothetical protein
LYFTTFAGGQNVNRVDYNYNGLSFTLSGMANIASTPGADGIVFAPDGDLLIGGQGNAVHKVNRTTGTFQTRTAGGAAAFHMAMDPSGNNAWASGIPGQLASIPLNPFSNGIVKTITGNDTAITSLSFKNASTVVYTASGAGGHGNFGIMNMSNPNNFVTTRIYSNLESAHGMTYDAFTDCYILMGDGMITQIDADTFTILGSRSFGSSFQFDQGTVDGNGHLFAASNDGRMLFMDYSATGQIWNLSNFAVTPFLAANLDDIAPLSGFGAVPVPNGVLLAGIGVSCLLVQRLRQRRKAALAI